MSDRGDPLSPYLFILARETLAIKIREDCNVQGLKIGMGKDKVKRLALISDIEMGGLKMLDIQSMICAKRITCLKKLLEDYSSPWKVILDKLLLPVGGRFVLHCNFQTSKLKISLPAYYKECFDAWSEVNGKTPSCYEEIINEIIWNNKFLCYDKKIDVQKRYSKLRLRED